MFSTEDTSSALSAQQLWLRDAELLASEAEDEGEGEAASLSKSPPAPQGGRPTGARRTPEERRKLARRLPTVGARRPGLALKIGRRKQSDSAELTGHGRCSRHAVILLGTALRPPHPYPDP